MKGKKTYNNALCATYRYLQKGAMKTLHKNKINVNEQSIMI